MKVLTVLLGQYASTWVGILCSCIVMVCPPLAASCQQGFAPWVQVEVMTPLKVAVRLTGPMVASLNATSHVPASPPLTVHWFPTSPEVSLEKLPVGLLVLKVKFPRMVAAGPAA